MSLLLGTAKTKIYIGTAPLIVGGADFVAADFDAVTWTEIKGHTNLGTIGDTAEKITSPEIGRGRLRKLKGVRDAGSQALVCDLDIADAGQLALIAAEKTNTTWPIRIDFNDAPDAGTPSQRLFTAFVMSAAEQFDDANSVIKLNVSLELDSNIVKIAAAA